MQLNSRFILLIMLLLLLLLLRRILIGWLTLISGLIRCVTTEARCWLYWCILLLLVLLLWVWLLLWLGIAHRWLIGLRTFE